MRLFETQKKILKNNLRLRFDPEQEIKTVRISETQKKMLKKQVALQFDPEQETKTDEEVEEIPNVVIFLCTELLQGQFKHVGHMI